MKILKLSIIKRVMKYAAESSPGKNSLTHTSTAELPDLLSKKASEAIRNNQLANHNIPFNAEYDELTTPLLRSIAKNMYSSAKKDYNKYFKLFQDAFHDTPASLTGRIKEPYSILTKLEKRKHFLTNESGNLLQNANDCVPDLYGYKLVLNSGSRDEVNKVFKELTKMLKNKKLKPSHFMNYGTNPYFTPEQCAELEKLGMYFYPVKKPSGYSCVNSYFYNENGRKIELQIIGKKTNTINIKEHLSYNYLTKGAATEHGMIVRDYQKVFDRMTEKQWELYKKYTNECYTYARKYERGIPASVPELPVELSPLLKLV